MRRVWAGFAVIAVVALVGGVGCKRKNKGAANKPYDPNQKTHQLIEKKPAADLDAVKKAFNDANDGEWSVDVDPFTGYVLSAIRKPAAAEGTEKGPKGIIKQAAVKVAHDFMDKNKTAFGLNAELLSTQHIEVAGAPGKGDKRGTWLIILRGLTHFPHPGFDAYDLGDRIHVRMVVEGDGVTHVEQLPLLPDPKLPDTPPLMWNDPKVTAALGGAKTEGAPEQTIHVLKEPNRIIYKVAWKFQVGSGESKTDVWVDAGTGAKLPAPVL